MVVTAATPLVEETSFCSVVRRGSAARGSLWVEGEPVVPAVELVALVPSVVEPEWLGDPEEGGACAGVPRVTATISGPLTPGPKFADMRSYARRAVVEVDSAATSSCPRLSDSSGIVSGSRIAKAAKPASAGGLAMSAAHFAHA